MSAGYAERKKIACALNMALGGEHPWETTDRRMRIADGTNGRVFRLGGEYEGYAAKLIPLVSPAGISPSELADEAHEHFLDVQMEAELTKRLSDLAIVPKLLLYILPQASGYWARCGALVMEKMDETLGDLLSRAAVWDPDLLREYLEMAARASGELCSAFGRYPVDLKPANTLIPRGDPGGLRLIDFSNYGCPPVPGCQKEARDACEVAGAFFAYANTFWYVRHDAQRASLQLAWDGYLEKVGAGTSRRRFCQLVLGEAAVDHLAAYSVQRDGALHRDTNGLCSWEKAFVSAREALEGIGSEAGETKAK